jgi:hypothetical protein
MSGTLQNLLSLRREAQSCLVETNVSQRLQRQIQLASALDILCSDLEIEPSGAEDYDLKKIQLLKDQLKVIPPRVDAHTPQALRDLATRLDGSIWTEDLIAMLHAEFKQLMLKASEANAQMVQSQAELRELDGSLDIFRTYVSLMAALTGEIGQEETR